MTLSRSSALALALVAASLGGCAHRAAPARQQPQLAGEPHLEAETLAGERVELGGPGPVRLVELWATWCTPCGPAAERARTVLARHPGVVAYAVSVDVDREAVRRHVAWQATAGQPLVLAGGPNSAARQGLDRLPTFLALDPRGRLVGTVTGLSPGLAPALDRLLRLAEGRTGEPD